jgi:hypothetical protein
MEKLGYWLETCSIVCLERFRNLELGLGARSLEYGLRAKRFEFHPLEKGIGRI